MSNKISNNQRFYKTLLSLALIPTVAISTVAIAGASWNQKASAQVASSGNNQIIAQNIHGFIASFWQRRPRTRNVSRSGLCAIAPGVIDTYIVWHEKPMFLWNYNGKPATGQIVVRDYDTQETLWQQNVDINTKKIAYGGAKPLEAGKLYQWKLSGNPSSPWITFKIMPTTERQKIATDLQAIEQKPKTATSQESQEEIALQKANYFLDYKVTHRTQQGTFSPWSDALQVLNEVENPSANFIKQRDQFIVDAGCSSSQSTVRRAN